MNESVNRTVRKFNPGIFQSDEEVIESFVVRKRELDVLRGNLDASSCQHVLLIAPRGPGKCRKAPARRRRSARRRAHDPAQVPISSRMRARRFDESALSVITSPDRRSSRCSAYFTRKQARPQPPNLW